MAIRLSRRRKWWLAGIAGALLVVTAGLFIAASIMARKFEPFIREQAVAYLSERFNSDVELKALRIRMPKLSPLRLWHSKGHGSIARVEGEGISMRQSESLPPLFAMNKFAFEVDLGSVWERRPVVSHITIDGMDIHVPPKGERPRLSSPDSEGKSGDGPKVTILDVTIRNARLVILPKDRSKVPLNFRIANLRMDSTGEGTAMSYKAQLTNPKPPGQIDSSGTFGPWVTEDPSDTPLAGNYVFEKADLGVFSGIAGILDSTGKFKGSLGAIEAEGEARVPDFRLTMANNPVPLTTRFQVLVDGTNGNTVLKPVHARLGSTDFTTSGGIIKHEGDKRRSIGLDVSMPRGNIQDLLRLATKGSPFMEGQIALKTKIDIPPLSGTVREKLALNGRFTLSNGKFLKSNIQDQIDSLSRRGQGEPKNEEIDQVVSLMKGRFRLENEVLTFSALTFGVPGADVDLAGIYNIDTDALDFHGALKLRAKVSQTMTGWKRWALKPVDPFFSKNGAGTFLRIKVVGTSKKPEFGLDRGGGKRDSAASRRSRGQRVAARQ